MPMNEDQCMASEQASAHSLFLFVSIIHWVLFVILVCSPLYQYSSFP